MKAIQLALWGVLLIGVTMLGCSDHDQSAVQVEGNVVDVQNLPAASAHGTAEPRLRIASRTSWISRSWLSQAMAQSSCGAAVEGVLACLATEHSSGGFAGTCAPVRSDCQFDVEIELDTPGDTLNLFFCFDSNGNAVCDSGEPSAPYLNFDKVGNFCNGDRIRVTNVGIDFSSQTCTGSPASVIADGCLPPDPTPLPTRTPVPPRPTPNSTQAQPTATPPPTETPTPTSTPPPPTPTPAPQSPPPPQCVRTGGDCGGEGRSCCSGNVCTLQGDNGPFVCVACAVSGARCDSSADCCNESDVCLDNGRCGVPPCTPNNAIGCDTTPCCDQGDVCTGNTCSSP